jgi:hypothetical protein
MKRRFLPMFGLAAVVLACAGLSMRGLDELRTNQNPERIFRRYEQDLRTYVARLQAGGVRAVSDGKADHEYAIPQFLIDRGATRVTWHDGRAIIQFFVGPVDAVPELWYSPNGFDAAEIEQRRQRAGYFRWEQLAPDWAACYWDS